LLLWDDMVLPLFVEDLELFVDVFEAFKAWRGSRSLFRHEFAGDFFDERGQDLRCLDGGRLVDDGREPITGGAKCLFDHSFPRGVLCIGVAARAVVETFDARLFAQQPAFARLELRLTRPLVAFQIAFHQLPTFLPLRNTRLQLRFLVCTHILWLLQRLLLAGHCAPGSAVNSPLNPFQPTS
jgi:hypothetical protein